jgi:TatD DNase family protein
MVDSHAHLQHAQFDLDRGAVIERAVAAGIERILVPGWDVPSSEAALELADRHAPVVVAAVGVHPHDASAMDAESWRRVETLAKDARCAAVGEIGLDYHRNLSPPDVQREVFARQLELAAERNLPVLVHCREAHADVTDALLAWRGRAGSDARGALHAFSGDAAMATTLAAAGFLISFALPVAFRSATGPRIAAGALPAAALLVETDSPYLGPDRERRNEPTTALRVAAELAVLRGSTPESIAAAARDAFERLVVA